MAPPISTSKYWAQLDGRGLAEERVHRSPDTPGGDLSQPLQAELVGRPRVDGAPSRAGVEEEPPRVLPVQHGMDEDVARGRALELHARGLRCAEADVPRPFRDRVAGVRRFLAGRADRLHVDRCGLAATGHLDPVGKGEARDLAVVLENELLLLVLKRPGQARGQGRLCIELQPRLVRPTLLIEGEAEDPAAIAGSPEDSHGARGVEPVPPEDPGHELLDGQIGELESARHAGGVGLPAVFPVEALDAALLGVRLDSEHSVRHEVHDEAALQLEGLAPALQDEAVLPFLQGFEADGLAQGSEEGVALRLPGGGSGGARSGGGRKTQEKDHGAHGHGEQYPRQSIGSSHRDTSRFNGNSSNYRRIRTLPQNDGYKTGKIQDASAGPFLQSAIFDVFPGTACDGTPFYV